MDFDRLGDELDRLGALNSLKESDRTNLIAGMGLALECCGPS